LLYTGVRKDDNGEEFQTQCIAVGDGIDYNKINTNPVIDEKMLPQGTSRSNFRDPKIWKEEDGIYRCVAGTCDESKKEQFYYLKVPTALNGNLKAC
jgi:beta-fructofuranosidase